MKFHYYESDDLPAHASRRSGGGAAVLALRPRGRQPLRGLPASVFLRQSRLCARLCRRGGAVRGGAL